MKKKLICNLVISALIITSITSIFPQQKASANGGDKININTNDKLNDNSQIDDISTFDKENQEIKEITRNINKFKDGNINIYSIVAEDKGYVSLNTTGFYKNTKYIYKYNPFSQEMKLYTKDKNKSSYCVLEVNKDDIFIVSDSDILNKENVWLLIDNKWFNLSNGIINKGWLNYKNDKYYLDNNGIMYTGWLYLNNKWYHFSESGALTTGWLLDTTGKWYFFNEDGEMLKNQYIDDKFYLSDDGSWDRKKDK